MIFLGIFIAVAFVSMVVVVIVVNKSNNVGGNYPKVNITNTMQQKQSLVNNKVEQRSIFNQDLPKQQTRTNEISKNTAVTLSRDKFLFAYGDLNPIIMENYLGREVDYFPAKLNGWKQVYFGSHITIIQAKNTFVDGLIYAVNQIEIDHIAKKHGYKINDKSFYDQTGLPPKHVNFNSKLDVVNIYTFIHNKDSFTFNNKIDLVVVDKDKKPVKIDGKFKYERGDGPNILENESQLSEEKLQNIMRFKYYIQPQGDDILFNSPIYILKLYNIKQADILQDVFVYRYSNNKFIRVYFYFTYDHMNKEALHTLLKLPMNSLNTKEVVLDNWLRCFQGWNDKYGCSTANIIESKESNVEGIIYELTEGQMRQVEAEYGFKSYMKNDKKDYIKMMIINEDFKPKNIFTRESEIIRASIREITSNTQKKSGSIIDFPVYTFKLSKYYQNVNSFNFENNKNNEKLRKRGANVKNNAIAYVSRVARLLDDTKKDKSNKITIPIVDHKGNTKLHWTFVKEQNNYIYKPT